MFDGFAVSELILLELMDPILKVFVAILNVLQQRLDFGLQKILFFDQLLFNNQHHLLTLK